MQKVISFDKTLEFKTMVGEVTSISLDPKLDFSDDSSISGELVISGKYKLTAASRLEEDFLFHLPIEIVLTESLEPETRKVAIDDFRYEVMEDDTLNCHIDLLVEGVEKIDISEEDVELEDKTEDVRANISNEDDEVVEYGALKDDAVEEEKKEDNKIEEKIKSVADTNVVRDDVLEKVEKSSAEVTSDDDNHHDVGSLFSSFKDSDETFATYSIYIVRQNDTVEAIMEKYQVSREELESYNDLTNLTIGSKVIIPTHHE